jgi:hypothetical protein
LGFSVWIKGLGLGAWGSGFGVQGSPRLRLGVGSIEFGVKGLGFRV